MPLAFCYCAKQNSRKLSQITLHRMAFFPIFKSFVGDKILYYITVAALSPLGSQVVYLLKFRIFFPPHLSPQLDIAKCNTSIKHVELQDIKSPLTHIPQFQGDQESKGLETWLNILQWICCRPFKQLICVCVILCACICCNMCWHWVQHFKLASLTRSSPFPTCPFSSKT